MNDDVAEIRAAYAHMEDLKSRGVIDIVQNKNRYIDGPTITGYLDGAHCFIQTSNLSPVPQPRKPLIQTLGPKIPTALSTGNLLIVYKGFLAEVQILVAGIYQLKGEQTPLYNLARSLGLVGPLQPQHALLVDSAAGTDRVKPPHCTRVLLVALRVLVALNCTWMAPFYIFLLFMHDLAVIKPKVDDEVVEEPTYDPQVVSPTHASRHPHPQSHPELTPHPPITPQISTPLSLWGIQNVNLPIRIAYSLVLAMP